MLGTLKVEIEGPLGNVLGNLQDPIEINRPRLN